MPDLPEGVREHSVEVAVPVGNLLYVIEIGSPLLRPWEHEDKFCTGGLHCLKLDEEDDAGNKTSRSRLSKDRWCWWDLFVKHYSLMRWLWRCSRCPRQGPGARAHVFIPPGGPHLLLCAQAAACLPACPVRWQLAA